MSTGKKRDPGDLWQQPEGLPLAFNQISLGERQWMGHYLHEHLCQSLTGISLLIQLQRQKVTQPESEDKGGGLEPILQILDQTLAQTRALMNLLLMRHDVAETLGQMLQRLATYYGRLYPVNIHFDHNGEERPGDPDQATTVCLLAQCLLDEAIHHHQAQTIWIHWAIQAGQAQLTVTDDGLASLDDQSTQLMTRPLIKIRTRQLQATVDQQPEQDGHHAFRCQFPLALSDRSE